MGDHQQAAVSGAPPLLQVLGKPGHALHVEVVGGLVEHDDVVISDEELRERHAALLPAGEGVHAGVPVHLGHESAHDVADRRVGGPLVVGLVADDGGADVEIAVEHVALVQVAHGDVAAFGDAAVVGRSTLGEQAHQGGFAVTVAPDHTDPVALFDSEGDAVQDGAGGEGDADVFSTEQVGQGKYCFRYG